MRSQEIMLYAMIGLCVMTSVVCVKRVVDNLATLGVYSQNLGVLNPNSPRTAVTLPLNLTILENHMWIIRDHITNYPNFISIGAPSVLERMVHQAGP